MAYASPSDAASAIAGKRIGGWWFFLTDQASRTSLRKIRRDYVNAMAVDAEDDEPDDDDDDEGIDRFSPANPTVIRGSRFDSFRGI